MSTNDEWLEVKMRLQGARQFMAEVAGAAAGVASFGVASEEAAAKTRLSNLESRAMQQGMYTLRRYTFWATTAVGAFGVATLKLGLSFDEAKMQGTEAFAALLGSSRLANQEMTALVGLSHQTGVQLGILTSEAEQMQGFGFSVKQVNTYMAALANYAERSGRGAGGLLSLVEVFDRIRQHGQLTSLDLRTLTMQGIPALRILAQQLHLSAQQQAALQQGKLIIPARYALPALASGIGARANLLGTNLGQQLGITHSYLASLFGGGEQGIFSFATRGLERINTALKARSGGGSFLQTLDPSGTLLIGWHLLTAAVRGAIAPFVTVFNIGKGLLDQFPILGGSLRFLAKQTWLVEAAMFALATWYAVTRTRMLLFLAATKLVSVAETAYIALLYALDYAAVAASSGMTLLNLAMDANPIGLIILGVAGLVAGLVLLVTHLKTVAHWAREAWHWLSHYVLFGWLFGGSAGGATAFSHTRAGVQGSHPAQLPRGPQVQPTRSGTGGGPEAGLIHHAVRSGVASALQGARVDMDGKKVGEIVFDWQGRMGARA